MRGIKKIFGAMVAVTMGAFALGCEGDDTVVSNVPGVDSGTLVQSWSIEGMRDASKCTQYGADRMRVVVFDEDGTVHATEFASCSSFAISLKLLARRYSGAATFVNADGNPISQTLAIEPFSVEEERVIERSIDFSVEAMKL